MVTIFYKTMRCGDTAFDNVVEEVEKAYKGLPMEEMMMQRG